MPLTSKCPKCEQQVIVPDGLDAEALVRCPLCLAEYLVGDALSKAPPMLIVVSPAAPAGGELGVAGEPVAEQADVVGLVPPVPEEPAAEQAAIVAIEPLAREEPLTEEAAAIEFAAPGEPAAEEPAAEEAIAGAIEFAVPEEGDTAGASAPGEPATGEVWTDDATTAEMPTIEHDASEPLAADLWGDGSAGLAASGIVPSGSTKGQEPISAHLWSDAPVQVGSGSEGDAALGAHPWAELPAEEHHIEASAEEEAFSFSEHEGDENPFAEAAGAEEQGAERSVDMAEITDTEEDDSVPFAESEDALQPVDLAALTRANKPQAPGADRPDTDAPRPKKKRKKQEVNPVFRMLAIVIGGLLSLPAVFLIGSFFKEDVDVWHLFHKDTVAVKSSKPVVAKHSNNPVDNNAASNLPSFTPPQEAAPAGQGNAAHPVAATPAQPAPAPAVLAGRCPVGSPVPGETQEETPARRQAAGRRRFR